MKPICIWCFSVMAFWLAGCNAMFSDESVIGPDLGHNGPFDAAHDVLMTQGFTYRTEGVADQERVRRITITRGPVSDTGTLVNVFTNTEKPFLAGIGYHALTPIVAETNATAKTYWLISFNASRTPDRSLYVILRYPRDLKIAPGLSSDAFEYVTLTCHDLLVARRPVDYWAPKPAGAAPFPEPAPDPAPEAGPCEFNSLAELDSLSALLLKRYDQIKHDKDAPTLDWQNLHVEVK